LSLQNDSLVYIAVISLVHAKGDARGGHMVPVLDADHVRLVRAHLQPGEGDGPRVDPGLLQPQVVLLGPARVGVGEGGEVGADPEGDHLAGCQGGVGRGIDPAVIRCLFKQHGRVRLGDVGALPGGAFHSSKDC